MLSLIFEILPANRTSIVNVMKARRSVRPIIRRLPIDKTSKLYVPRLFKWKNDKLGYRKKIK